MSALTHEEANPLWAYAADINRYYQDIADRVSEEEKTGWAGQYFDLYKFHGEDGFTGELLARSHTRSLEYDTFMMGVVTRLCIDGHDLVLPKTYKLVWDRAWAGGRPVDVEPLTPDTFEGCPLDVARLHGVLEQVHQRFVDLRPNIAVRPRPVTQLYPNP
jgi:hypothetical protein